MNKTATSVQGRPNGGAPARPVSVRRVGANIFGILAAKDSGPEPILGWSPTRRALNGALLAGGAAFAAGAAASLLSACKSKSPEPETSPPPKKIPPKVEKPQKRMEQLLGELHARIIGGDAALYPRERELINRALTHGSGAVREQAGEAFALTSGLFDEDLDILFGSRTILSDSDDARARGGMKGLVRKLESDPFDARYVIGALERMGGLEGDMIDPLIRATNALAGKPHYGEECGCLADGDCSPVRALYMIASSGRHDMGKAVPALFNAVENLSCSSSWAFKAIRSIALSPEYGTSSTGGNTLFGAPDSSHLVVAPLARLVDTIHGDERLAEEAVTILEKMALQKKDIKEAVPALEYLFYHKSMRVDVARHVAGALACHYRYHLGGSKFGKMGRLMDHASCCTNALQGFSGLSVEEVKGGEFTRILEKFWRRIRTIGRKRYPGFVAHDMEPPLYRMLAQHYAIRGEWRKIKTLYPSDTGEGVWGPNRFYGSLRDSIIDGLSALSKKGWDLSPLSAEEWYQKISVRGP